MAARIKPTLSVDSRRKTICVASLAPAFPPIAGHGIIPPFGGPYRAHHFPNSPKPMATKKNSDPSGHTPMMQHYHPVIY